MLVTGGGLPPDGKWRDPKKFFLPVKLLSSRFRSKFPALFKQKLPDVSQRFLEACRLKKWAAYCKPPFGSAEKVAAYLGRYTYRVAISNGPARPPSSGRIMPMGIK